MESDAALTGTVILAVPSGDTKIVNVTNHFNGVTDMDSFRKSQGQISRNLGRVVSGATSRS